jgi:hypothetical protein
VRAGTHMENRKDFRERVDGQPQKDAPVSGCAGVCAVRPAADVGAADGGRSTHARSAHARQTFGDKETIL